MLRTNPLLALGVLLSLATVSRADDAFFHVSFKDLEFTEGKLPAPESDEARTWNSRAYRLAPQMQPYAVVDGKGEAYVRGESSPYTDGAPEVGAVGQLFVRAPQGEDVTGSLMVPKPDYTGMTRLKFRVPKSKANDKFANEFYQQKVQHYQSLLNRGIPGGAWYRHQIQLADRELGKNAAAPNPNLPRIVDSTTQVEDTFDLFSGGRALAENLQLERSPPGVQQQRAKVDIASLDGITIAAIDWKKLLKEDSKPTLDPLAAAIPADQHAIFFPSFAKMIEVADHLDEQGSRILSLADPRSEDARTKERYERQLCLSTSALSRLLGPALVKSVAMTGSDPYFVSGTDVAVLFEAANPTVLHALIAARVASGAESESAAKAVEGKIEGVAYSGFRSADRRVSSYVARLDGVVVVANSLPQLTQLVRASKDKLPTIGSLPEYKFFRTRYERGAVDESAFLFLSDATIRRWCGPRWRIASSRRVRGAAILSELETAYLDDLVAGRVEAGPIHTDLAGPDPGELRLTSRGVTSSAIGSTEFQTPIIELPLEKVTEQEAEFYKRWRDTYQQNWNWAFDPIALRITANDKKLAGDLTVMPLIVNTEYRQFIGFATGAEIKPSSGDPHDALVHFVTAFNRDAAEVREADNMLKTMIQGAANPLSWLGSSIAIYADDDPFWADLAKQTDDDQFEKFFEQNLHRLPVAIYVDVASPLKLTGFIVGLRLFVEQTAPGMVAWESLTYHDTPYVKISPTERGKGQLPPDVKEPSLYYAISGDSLLVTFNLDMLKRALDRQTVRRAAKPGDKTAVAPARPWLGKSACLTVDKKMIGLLSDSRHHQYENELRLHSWNNLPILTEWKLRYPDQDPVELHEKYFNTRLVCPGGGQYVWNQRWQTMESTAYGHPGEPKPGPTVPALLSGFSDLNFGLTFEDKGLRARMELPREKTK